MLNTQNITSISQLRELVGKQVIYHGQNTLLIDVLAFRVQMNTVFFRGRLVKWLQLKNDSDSVFKKRILNNPEFEFKAPISTVRNNNLCLLENDMIWRAHCSFSLWNLPEYLNDLKHAEIQLQYEKNARAWRLEQFGFG